MEHYTFVGVGCIFPIFFNSEDEKMAKIANFSMSTCVVQVNIELLDKLICMLGKKVNMGSNIDRLGVCLSSVTKA